MKTSRRSAFTLVEMLVVLAVAAIVSAITVGTFSSIREGNRRTSCQSNLSQIYQAGRLYAQDNEKFPYYNPGVASGPATPNNGLGLWALYTYPNLTDTNGDGKLNDPADTDSGYPVRTYLRNMAGLHCPNDSYTRPDNANSIMSSLPYKADTVLNTDYLSYQVTDDSPSASTYSSFRGGAEKRQLDYYTVVSGNALRSNRPMDDTTVVLWCRFHRRMDGNSNTVANGRNYDNVLFGDGSVQLLPVSQNVSLVNPTTGNETATGTCSGWNRVPRGMADSLPDNDPKFNCP